MTNMGAGVLKEPGVECLTAVIAVPLGVRPSRDS